MFGEEEIVRSHKMRADIIKNIIFLAFALIIARLWYLQIYKGDLLYEYSLKNKLRQEIIKAPRGMFFDRNNEMLVNNTPRFDAVLTPQYLQDKENTLRNLAKILNMSAKSVKAKLKKSAKEAKYKPVIIKRNISRKEVALIETQNSLLPGVSVDAFISREYIDKEIGSHLMGYISEISKSEKDKLNKKGSFQYKDGDLIGKAGLEEIMDHLIRGINGYEYVEVDAFGRKKRHIKTDNFFVGIKNQLSIPGKNLRLTIDRDLQKVAYDSLEGMVGGAVALDVNTGEVLAMVSRPGFDPSKFSKVLSSDYWSSLVKDERKPLRDHTRQDHYPPGSTFKTITAIAALEENIIDEKTEVNCTGSFKFGRKRFNCWRKYGHGKTDIYKAIRESCDTFFYKIATKLDIDVLAKYAKMFGLGMLTGIDLPGEAKGLIPSKEWKVKTKGEEWIAGETIPNVIGQSFVLTTPLQLALAYSTIANGGKVYKPYIVKEVFRNSGEITFQNTPKVESELNLNEKTLKIIKQALYEVASHHKGTAWWKRGSGIDMSGKTGTSQVLRLSTEKLFTKCEEFDYKSRHHVHFVGYAPKDNPKIVVSVTVEHGCYSKITAGIAVKIMEEYMKKYEPDLHKKIKKKDKYLMKRYLAMKKQEQEDNEE